MNNTAKSIFDVLSKIDEGSFGHVYLVKKRGGVDDSKEYAMKLVFRDGHTDKEYNNAYENEFNMFNIVRGAPFLIQMKYAIKKSSYFYYVLEYSPVGDMFRYLRMMKRMTMAETIISTMEIIEAIGYLHEHKIIYRDLKLENILIGTDGHIMLTDFGLARQLEYHERLYDSAGTYEYMAPELIEIIMGHSYEVDWWALAILMHELLTGHSPFLTSMHEKVTEETHKLRILEDVPVFQGLQQLPEAKNITDFLQKLLAKDAEQRLGFGQKGYIAVKQHKLFSRLSWNALKLKMYNGLDRCASKRCSPRLSADLACKLPVFNETSYVAPELCAEREIVPHYGFTEADLTTFDKEIPLTQPDLHITHQATYLRCKPNDAASYLNAMCSTFDSQDCKEEEAQSVTLPLAIAHKTNTPRRILQPINSIPRELPSLHGLKLFSIVLHRDKHIKKTIESKTVPKPQKVTKSAFPNLKILQANQLSASSLPKLRNLSIILHRDCRISNDLETVPTTTTSTKPKPKRRKLEI